ncbi:adenylate cyclase type 7 isoform X1 [Eumetopias jubatus]|uniref:adenylate cyclase type 7 isoform X1 n=1 Tax=Eumetopias jubatus TaxID=34886 RepID=UPI0010161371|nr:adenylate cyclase type 7 isoform X1 [Eumetopias jubatus]
MRWTEAQSVSAGSRAGFFLPAPPPAWQAPRGRRCAAPGASCSSEGDPSLTLAPPSAPSGLSLLLPEPPCLLSPASSARFGIPAGWLICVSIRPSVYPSVCSTSNCQGSAAGHRHRSFPSCLVRQVLGCVTQGTMDQGVGRPPQLGRDQRGDGGRALHGQRCGEARGRWALGTQEAGVKGSKTESPGSHKVSLGQDWAEQSSLGLSLAKLWVSSRRRLNTRPPQSTKVLLATQPVEGAGCGASPGGRDWWVLGCRSMVPRRAREGGLSSGLPAPPTRPKAPLPLFEATTRPRAALGPAGLGQRKPGWDSCQCCLELRTPCV